MFTAFIYSNNRETKRMSCFPPLLIEPTGSQHNEEKETGLFSPHLLPNSESLLLSQRWKQEKALTSPRKNGSNS